MADYITLMGAEDVSRAASRMQSAADSMNNAASYFQSIFEQHQRFMDDWLTRFEAAQKEPAND
jgi:hypothetical protein